MPLKSLTLVVLFYAAALGPRAFGQASDGNLVGSVLDSSGAVITTADVDLTNVETGVKTPAKTDAAGEFRFNNVPIGTYQLTVNAPGFTTGRKTGIIIELNKTATANISLEVGPQSDKVTVTDSPELLDTTTAQISKIYDARMTAGLPLATNPVGGVYNLALLSPGVTSAGGFGTGYGPSVGGLRPRENNFTIEGVDNNNKQTTGPNIFLPNDAVAEFTTLQNQFSAEFGHNSGGQFNTVIKSGTNELHGTVYEYLQNRLLDANDQSAARQGILSPPRDDQNRLGATAGGPIMKNKWFIFGAYEYNPLGETAPVSAPIYSPTQAGYNLLNSMTGISQTNLGILEKYAPSAPGAAVDSTTVNGVSIPYGILPVLAPTYTNTYTWLVSSDYTISDRDQLRGRYIDYRQTGLDATADLPVFFVQRPTTGKLATISEFHSFTPTLFNEVRLAVSRYNSDTPAPNASYPGLDAFPNIVIRNDLNLQIGPDPTAPQAQLQTVYQIIDNFSWSKGRHELKFGFDGRDEIAASTFVQKARGDYEWTSLEGFLNDTVPDAVAQRNPAGKPFSGNATAYYWYVNDNWRYNQHLTINLGLRYEFNGVAQSWREFALNSIADVPGILTFQAPQAAKKNFAPRIGVAYSPGSRGDTVIRAGFGMGYDQIFDNVGVNVRPPQSTYTVDITGNPGGNFLQDGGIKAVPFTPATARAATSSWTAPNQILPYAITWNVGVQHSFAKDYTAEVRYIGTKGVHLIVQEQINRDALVTSTNFLPTYLQLPSQATLDSLKLTSAALSAAKVPSNPAYDPLGPYGFTNTITTYAPRGNSEYHGLALDLKKRYSRNLLFDANYTWSHDIDDSSAETNSIVATPRRPQDFNNLSGEKGNSALDRRNRLTLTTIYDTPWFSGARNPLLRNGVGNWEVSGSYMLESGEWATPQGGGVDANLNGDTASDRVILNPSGVPGTSSDVTALHNSSGATVAYLANNPTAEFIRAQVGAYANSGRNILATPRIDNVELSIAKNFSFRERIKLQLHADLFNALNHPQYTLGEINSVTFRSGAGSAPWFVPGNPLFRQWDQVFSSNPRFVQVGAKVTF